MSRFSLFFVLIPIISKAAAVCKENPLTECGCPRRGTFDQAYLEKDYPRIAAKHSGFHFYAPTVTYPDCSAIISNCPQPNSIMTALINNDTDITTMLDYVTLTNPFNLLNVFCTPIKEWFNPGSGSLQAKLDSYKLGCMKAN